MGGSFKGRPRSTPNRTTSVTTITIPGEVLEAAKKHGIIVSRVATEAVKKEIQKVEAMALNKTEEDVLVARLKKEKAEMAERAGDVARADAKRWFPHAKYEVLKWFESELERQERAADGRGRERPWADAIRDDQDSLFNGGEEIAPNELEDYWAAFAEATLDMWGKISDKV